MFAYFLFLGILTSLFCGRSVLRGICLLGVLAAVLCGRWIVQRICGCAAWCVEIQGQRRAAAVAGFASVNVEKSATQLKELDNGVDSKHRASFDLDQMDGREFEKLIADLLVSMGLEVQLTKASGDGGVDILATSHEPITGGKYVVQCKRHESNVGEPVLRDLFGVMHHWRAAKGVLVTNSSFSQPARHFAADKPIELIDGNALRALLTKHGLNSGSPRASVSETSVPMSEQPELLIPLPIACSVFVAFGLIILIMFFWLAGRI